MKKTRIVAVVVLMLGLTMEVVKADFIFGTPVNLGPTINSSAEEWAPSISSDGLELYIESNRPGGSGNSDVWVSARATTEDTWGAPMNLGAPINTPGNDNSPRISADGLELYFDGLRVGNVGGPDLWVTRRETTNSQWSAPVNLGPPVNSTSIEKGAAISSDGLELYFGSNRPGGSGSFDLWVATRATASDPWGEPVNLGPTINSSVGEWFPSISADGLVLFFQDDIDLFLAQRRTTTEPFGAVVKLPPQINTSGDEGAPCVSSDGSTLYFASNRSGGSGDLDLWQVPIDPIVDLNGDGIVDAADICIVVDNWGTDNSLCDVGPMPWGDGVVDVEDLVVVAEHLFESFPLAEPVQ